MTQKQNKTKQLFFIESSKITSPKTKKPTTTTKDENVVWQWKNDDGDWCDYVKEDSELIERFHSSGVKTVTTDKLSFSASYGTEYELNFTTMTQQNLESKKIRNIRRNSGDDSMKEDIRQTSSSTTTTTKQSSSSSTTKAMSNRNIPHESEMVYYNEISVSNRSARKVISFCLLLSVLFFLKYKNKYNF